MDVKRIWSKIQVTLYFPRHESIVEHTPNYCSTLIIGWIRFAKNKIYFYGLNFLFAIYVCIINYLYIYGQNKLGDNLLNLKAKLNMICVLEYSRKYGSTVSIKIVNWV